MTYLRPSQRPDFDIEDLPTPIASTNPFDDLEDLPSPKMPGEPSRVVSPQPDQESDGLFAPDVDGSDAVPSASEEPAVVSLESPPSPQTGTATAKELDRRQQDRSLEHHGSVGSRRWGA